MTENPTTHFIFDVETYYTQNGCDCCEPDEWIVYNCASHCLNGSRYDELDALLAIVEYLDYEEYDNLLDAIEAHTGNRCLVSRWLEKKGITWEFNEK